MLVVPGLGFVEQALAVAALARGLGRGRCGDQGDGVLFVGGRGAVEPVGGAAGALAIGGPERPRAPGPRGRSSRPA